MLAAGTATRFGGGKQFLDLGAGRAVDLSLATVRPHVDGVTLVVPHADDWDGLPVDRVVDGGATRAGSMRAALATVPADVDVVLVHDAAHPLASTELTARVLAALDGGADGVAPGLPVVEALAGSGGGTLTVAVPRAPGMVSIQMPCAFRRAALVQVHASEPEGEECGLFLAAGLRVDVVPGEPGNIHVALPADAELARRLSRPLPPAAPAS